MKYLVFGLGNPGEEYQFTRHNIGFQILDRLASDSKIEFDEVKHGWMCSLKHKGRTIILFKPNTFMNLSGKAVNYWMQKEKVSIDRILVVTDDLALPFGKIRFRAKGSDGGHNGLKDIQARLGTTKYPRLRFGIDADFHKGQQINYVLGEWGEDEKATLNERIQLCCEGIRHWSNGEIGRTMSEFNGK